MAVVRERQLGFTLVLFGVATIIAVLYSIERYFYSRLVGDPVALAQLVPAELIFTYAWALLTPLVMFVAKRVPIWGNRPLRNWVLQIGAMVAFVLMHVTLFALATSVSIHASHSHRCRSFLDDICSPGPCSTRSSSAR